MLMRRVSIVVICDSCEEPIEEEVEGASVIRFTIRGEEKEMDLCGDCLHGSFLQEARPVTKRKSKGKDVPCEHCSKSFATERGLKRHLTMSHS